MISLDIYIVMLGGNLVAAFTDRHKMQRWLDEHDPHATYEVYQMPNGIAPEPDEGPVRLRRLQPHAI